ncbi:rRNA-binding ribosome biosynthesis protein utp25 [Elasticomyces elasticus]|nr:rRNA-binding ribosome biosynthesis protein utp25 [Elasticomyces elasticus]
MPPHYKSRRTNGARNGPNSKSKSRNTRFVQRSDFTGSRTQELDARDEDEIQPEPEVDLDEDDAGDVRLGHDLESEDDEQPAASGTTYTSLLRLLKPRSAPAERPTKRRRLNGTSMLEAASNLQHDPIKHGVEDEMQHAASQAEIEDDGTEEENFDSDDEATIAQDNFEQHYTKLYDKPNDAAITARNEKGISSKIVLVDGSRKLSSTYGIGRGTTSKTAGISTQLKRRLLDNGTSVLQNLGPEEAELAREIFSYRDTISGSRTVTNASRLRDATALHILNHIFKTRDRVLKNNAKLSQESAGDLELRDQGFTRPKVLVLLPTKQSCVKYIDSLVQLSQPDQQESRGRLMDTFSQPDDDSFANKPDDFQELFSGNHEEDFRVGLKFTRKTMKYFSGFYNSDIILASPLGLMRTISHGGGDKETSKQDSDFLSSIEICVMDQTSALEMQNWAHVDFVFSQLNLTPRDSHGCDFSRVCTWSLEGHAKYIRQTIILSDYLTPSLLSLTNTYCHNIAGTVRYTPTYPGSMTQLPTLPFQLTQSFLRFDSRHPQTDSDARFKFFTNATFPQILRGNKASVRGTLIFVPAYLDFVRLRNHFSNSTETTNLTFGTISEYSPVKDVARGRSHFLSGRQSLLLYTERAHHYFRYKLKGVRRVIFYGLPDNARFYAEMIEAIGVNARVDTEYAQSVGGTTGKAGRGVVRALFSKWDVMKLERVVGTDRVARLVRQGEGDVFDFV